MTDMACFSRAYGFIIPIAARFSRFSSRGLNVCARTIGATLLLVFTVSQLVQGQMPDPPGQVAKGKDPIHLAYLFAHMTHRDYGRLYYSVSTDGLHWRQLNGGRPVFNEYKGHPDICRGHDGRFYLVGNRNDESLNINIWVSDDLVSWTKYSTFETDLKHVPKYPTALQAVGAPKLFYDDVGKTYVLTWHTPHRMEKNDLPEPYWVSQRTLYVTSPDLKTFTNPPRRLFLWDMATIDVIIRRYGDKYYAILKDERYPSVDWPTGKTIRISSSSNLLGPYSEPGPPVSPGFREAPTLIPSPDGQAWYLYYEQYPGVSYGLSVSNKLEGPWFQASGATYYRDWDKYELPKSVRHGCMLPITRDKYDLLIRTFGEDS